MALKHFNERFSGWGGENRDGSRFGFEGYDLDAARRTQANVIANMTGTRGIKDIKVTLEPLGNGKYAVVNTSTYESNY